MESSSLLYIPKPKPNALFQLICFSYAGGSSDIFFPWLDKLHAQTELVVCQLPGRTHRILEAPYKNMNELLADLVKAIALFSGKRLIFFGHSLGSKVAYELTLMMRKNKLLEPLHFIASAAGAPHIPRRTPAISELPDALFLFAISRLSGTPLSIMNNKELMSLYLPALRADFTLIENHLNRSKTKISSRLTLLGGLQDKIVDAEDLIAWQELVVDDSGIHWLSGDHFFIKSQSEQVLQHINDILIKEEKILASSVSTI